MNKGDRVKYHEVAPCLPNRGHGTIIKRLGWGWLVEWDIGVTNWCQEEKLERV